MAGILRNNLAIPIGWLAIGCNLDWVTQFHGSSGITVNSPKWLIWVTNISSWVTNIVSRYHDKQYAHCLYSIRISDMRGMGIGICIGCQQLGHVYWFRAEYIIHHEEVDFEPFFVVEHVFAKIF